MKKCFWIFCFVVLNNTITTAQFAPSSGWEILNNPNGNAYRSVFFTDYNTGFIAGYSGQILKTVDGGTTWTNQVSGTMAHLFSLYFATSNIGYSVGNNGTILKTTDAGLNWIQQVSGTNKTLYSVWFTSVDTGYCVGSGGTILKTANGGIDWLPQESKTICSLHSVSFGKSDYNYSKKGYAVGSGGTILKTVDGGLNWVQDTMKIDYDLYSVHIDGGVVFIAGDRGKILKSYLDNAQSPFLEKIYNNAYPLYSVFYVLNGTVCAVGKEDYPDGINQITYRNSTTLKWSTNNDTRMGVPLYSCYFAGNKVGWAVGGSGIIIKTIDGGETWSVLKSPNYSLGRFQYFFKENTGYEVGYAGNIFKTADGGLNWEKQNSGTTNNLSSVYFIDNMEGYAIGANGTIVKTTNGGTSWELQTTGITNDLKSIYFTSNDVGYSVGVGGTILKTINGGTNWALKTSGVTTNLNSIYFTNKNTGYAVGSNGVILKTINEGEDWINLNSGVTFDLRAIRFIDNNFGYTVGDHYSFLSEYDKKFIKTQDAGDSWTFFENPLNSSTSSAYFTSNNVGYIGHSYFDSYLRTGFNYNQKTIDGGINWISFNSMKYNETIDIFFNDEYNGYLFCSDGSILKTTSGGVNLDISTNSVRIQAQDSSTNTIGLSSNLNWTTSISQPWLTINKLNGSGDAAITLLTSENSSVIPRAATITFSASGVPSKIVTVTQDPITTIINNTTNNNTHIYPNPTTGIVYFKDINPNARIEIYNLSGVLVQRLELVNNHINIKNLMNGTYIIKILDNNRINTFKIIKE